MKLETLTSMALARRCPCARPSHPKFDAFGAPRFAA